MSESAATSENGIERPARRIPLKLSPILAGTAVEFAQNVGGIAAKRLDRQGFNLSNDSRSVPGPFIRHIVAAQLRFSFVPALSWKEIGRIVHRDHTSVMYGCMSLALKVGHANDWRALFREINCDVCDVYPQAEFLEARLLEWAKHRSPKGLRP